MTEKRFVKHYDGRTEKRAIGIKDIETSRVYVTLEENIRLLNELVDENKELKEENEQLKKENQQLKYKNEILSDELEQAKAVINKKWSEYLKKKDGVILNE